MGRLLLEINKEEFTDVYAIDQIEHGHHELKYRYNTEDLIVFQDWDTIVGMRMGGNVWSYEIPGSSLVPDFERVAIAPMHGRVLAAWLWEEYDVRSVRWVMLNPESGSVIAQGSAFATSTENFGSYHIVIDTRGNRLLALYQPNELNDVGGFLNFSPSGVSDSTVLEPGSEYHTFFTDGSSVAFDTVTNPIFNDDKSFSFITQRGGGSSTISRHLFTVSGEADEIIAVEALPGEVYEAQTYVMPSEEGLIIGDTQWETRIRLIVDDGENIL